MRDRWTEEAFAGEAPADLPSFDSGLGRKIIALNIWAVRRGLLGADAPTLFAELCRQLCEADVPLSRCFAAMRTLHPQWAGYGYTWRPLSGIEPEQFERGALYESAIAESPFGTLIERVSAPGYGGPPFAHLRRRLSGPAAGLDFPILRVHAGEGATDYFAFLASFAGGDPARGSGVAYSFTTDRADGFGDDDLLLMKAVLPAVSLAMMAHTEHAIAAGLLATYLGADAGGRVHRGAVARGSVDGIRAVVWYADIRGFTALADATPGHSVVEMLGEIFETLAAPLRRRGGQVLKFLGDGMLAIFPIGAAGPSASCGEAAAAAAEAMAAVDALKAARQRREKPVATVDLALHLGEVLYGNVGAVDRLDFTVIGPAVNEAARIEALCEPLGERVLVSAEFAAAAEGQVRLRPLGRHRLRGVREERQIFALVL